MKIVLPVKDYARLKNITHQAAYQQIKDKKVFSEPVMVKKEEIGIAVDTNDLTMEELKTLQNML